MDKTLRTLGLGAALVAVAVFEGSGRTAADEPSPSLAPKAATFLKIGRHRINIDRIEYTRDEEDRLMVVFGGDPHEVLELRGAEAETLRRWLDEYSRPTLSRRPDSPTFRPGDFDPDRDLIKPIRMSDPFRTPQGEWPARSLRR
jgi:hypothetical protein